MTFVFFGIFIVIFLIVIEILCILFKLTGLSDEKAKFQVISIITGTGFTTKESELVTQHRTRRKLAQCVMIIGYLGLATFLSFISTIISNMLMESFSLYELIFIIVFLSSLFYLLKRPKLLLYLDNFIEKTLLKRNLKSINKKNLYILLSRKHGYGIYNIFVDENCFLVNKSILQSSLKSKEIQIINIDKGDSFIAFPAPSYIFEIGDSVILYGKIENILSTFKIR